MHADPQTTVSVFIVPVHGKILALPCHNTHYRAISCCLQSPPRAMAPCRGKALTPSLPDALHGAISCCQWSRRRAAPAMPRDPASAAGAAGCAAGVRGGALLSTASAFLVSSYTRNVTAYCGACFTCAATARYRVSFALAYSPNHICLLSALSQCSIENGQRQRSSHTPRMSPCTAAPASLAEHEKSQTWSASCCRGKHARHLCKASHRAFEGSLR